MLTSVHRYTQDKQWDRPFDASQDSSQTLIIVFAAARLSEAMSGEVDRLHSQFPQSIVVGCSSAGEICGEDLLDDSMIVAVTRFENTRLKRVETTIDDPDQSASAGQSLAEQLQGDDLTAVFTLTDGLLVNGSTYVRALSSALSDTVTITGGMAADGDRFEQTWTLSDGNHASGRIAAIGLYGDAVQVAHGSRGGWDLLGPDREVTRGVGNVLYSLDGQPALEVYKKYLGERAEGLPATGLLFPLAIRNEEEDDNMTVRTILAVDEEAQSITFAGDIPEGCMVKLMRANYDRLIDGAGEAAESLEFSNGQNEEALCIAISCVGRRLVLGPRAEEELEAVQDVVGENTAIVGYYSYGEISPLASGRCDLHNQTMTLTLISESR